MDKYLFQYCQKLVVFSQDHTKILLCQRKGEQDYDGVYSFMGGKMETTDASILDGIKREKNEEIGEDAKLLLYPLFNHVVQFKKKDGNTILLPHYYARYKTGTIKINEEYSNYQWIPIKNLRTFSPMIANIPTITKLMVALQPLIKEKELIEI